MITIDTVKVLTEEKTITARAEEQQAEVLRELSSLELSLVGGGTGIVQFR